MHKKLMCTVLSGFIALMVQSNVLSANINKDVSDIEISGRFPQAEKDTSVILHIYAPGKDSEDLMKQEGSYNDIIAYQNHAFTDKNGDYSFEVSLEGEKSGAYTAVISSNGKIERRTIHLININDNKSAISQLNEAALLDDELYKFKELCTEKKDDLGLWSELAGLVDEEKAKELFAGEIKRSPLDSNEFASAFSLYNKILLCEALSGNKIENMSDYSNDVDFSKTSIGKWYESDFVTKELWENVTDRLSGKNIAFYEFDKKLAESFVLATVKNPDGYGNAKALLNDFSEEIGIKKNAKEATYQKIAGSDFETFSELKNKFDELENTKKTESSNKGGGGTSSFGAKISSDIKNETIAPKEIAIDIFDDLGETFWAREAVVYLAEKGFINGKAENKFCPMDNITRAELAKILVGAFTENALAAQVGFDDVSENDWYYQYVLKAVSAGIAKGMGDNYFGANIPITRQDLAVMAYNAAKLKNIDLNEPNSANFADDESIAEYAKEAVYALASNGIISGMGNNKFCPDEKATRAQAAKIIYGILTD